MPSAQPSVWIIIPTYNERENVAAITDAVLGAVSDAHVLIVDDGSPDGTGALADEIAAANPAVAVLHRTAKEGLGRAYVDGFRHALAQGARMVLEMDCDFSSWGRATSRVARSRNGTSCGD